MAQRRSALAFQALMQEKPTSQYDSGEDGIFTECRSCRFHRPYARNRTCVFRICPYSPDGVSTERPKRWILAYVAKTPQRRKMIETQHYRHR